MEKELQQVQKDLLATQAQLDERSMPSPSQEQEHAQWLKLLDELREVNKENSILRKQVAGDMASNVANRVADSVASYRPCGIGPKNQLTGTDSTVYPPWRWAVNDKLRIDVVMYLEERDWISYAFHQLAQPMFQQLDA